MSSPLLLRVPRVLSGGLFLEREIMKKIEKIRRLREQLEHLEALIYANEMCNNTYAVSGLMSEHGNLRSQLSGRLRKLTGKP